MLEAISKGGEKGRAEHEDLEVRVPSDASYPPEGILNVLESGGQLGRATIVSV